MSGTMSILLTNAAIAGLLALVLLLFVGRLRTRPALLRGLCLLILVKLVTPPLMTVSVPSPFERDPEPVETIADRSVAVLTATGNGPGLPGESAHGADLADSTPTSAGTPRPGASQPGSGDGEQALVATGPSSAGRLLRLTTGLLGSLPWATIVSTIWIGGTLIYFLLITTRYIRFRGLLKSAVPATGQLAEDGRRMARRLGLARVPSIVTVSGRVSPLLWTLCRGAKVVLPAGLLEQLDRDARLSLIAHEMAHLRRRDHWVRLLEAVATGLYWWNPAVWWVRHQLQDAEEQCCDAWVLWAMPAGAHTYASSLVTTMDFLSQTRFALPPAASGAGHFDSLKRRLTMIMTGSTARSISPTGRIAVLVAALAVLPFLPSIADAPAPPDAPEPAPPPVARVAPDNEPSPPTAPAPRPPAPEVAPTLPEPASMPAPEPRPVVAPEPASMPAPEAHPVVAPRPASLPAPDTHPGLSGSRKEPVSGSRIRLEIELEISDAIAEYVEDYERELRTLRKDIRTAVLRESSAVQAGLSRLEFNETVDRITRNAPEWLRTFARELDVDKVVSDTLRGLELQGQEVDEGELKRVHRDAERELSAALDDLELDVGNEMKLARRHIRDSVRNSSPEYLRVIAVMDFAGMMDRLTRDLPEPVRQFVIEVDVPTVVQESLASGAI